MDLTQTRTTTEAGFVNGVTGAATAAAVHRSSRREIFTDQLDYVMNRTVSLFVSGGHENIAYSGSGIAPINDMTWSFGTTLTPESRQHADLKLWPPERLQLCSPPMAIMR